MASEFQGKFTFASSGVPTLAYLGPLRIRVSGSKTQLFPAMTLASPGTTGVATLYDAPVAGAVVIRLPEGGWLALDTQASPGLIAFRDDRADAAAFRRTVQGSSETWEVQDGSAWRPVYYATLASAPLLTVNPSATSGKLLVPAMITPPLSVLRVKGAQGADLGGVDFAAADLSGIDFAGADLTGASLDKAKADGANFTGATMCGLTFGSATADRAVFDDADMAGADLRGAVWGRPASARNLVLRDARAAGARLGTAGTRLDMTGAILTGADFGNATLDGIDLTGGTLSAAVLRGASLQGTTLDRTTLSRATFVGANLTKATLRSARADGANLTGANLTGADLGRADMGTQSYLFSLDPSFAAGLDGNRFPTPALVAAFKNAGAVLSGAAPVQVLAAGSKWRIADETDGPYALMLADGQIRVSRENALMPASLSGVLAFGTQASNAGLSGADLSYARWYGSGATLDHATLDNAALTNGYFSGTDFTQASLSGTDFSNAILCQATMAGVLFAPGAGNQMARFDGAAVAGVSFAQATLTAAHFFRALIATGVGVPVVALPVAAKAALARGDLSGVTTAFAAAGYPLGAQATVASVPFWRIDNAATRSPTAPRAYRVENYMAKYPVFDDDTGGYLFELQARYAPDLAKGTADSALVSAFSMSGLDLAPQAPIAPGTYFSVTPAPVAFAGPYAFSRIAIFEAPAALQAFGTDLLLLRDAEVLAQVAFSGTVSFTDALADTVIGPSGESWSAVRTGDVSLFDYLTARRPG